MRAAVLILILAVAAILPAPVLGQGAPADVQGHWAEQRILLLLQRNIVTTFPDQTFRPADVISRGEFIKWLVLARGLPVRPVRSSSFADVPPSHPFAPYVESALGQGLIPRAPAFLPGSGIRRSDAIALAVLALGYAFEAAPLVQRPLPFDDLDGLPDSARGAIAVAVFAQPPLLREPPSQQLRPSDAMTRGEAAGLIWACVMAVEEGITLRNTSAVAPGVDLVTEKRGVLRAQPVWRIQVGAFTTQENALRLAELMRERGLPAFVDAQDGFFKVRVGNFTALTEATLVRDQLAAEGYPTWLIATLPDFEGLAGPFRTAVLVVDARTGLRLIPAAGDGQRMRRQRTSEMAQRLGAVAAINGGFFSASGDSLGCLMIDGQIASEPDSQRTCAGVTSDGTVLFDRIRLDAAAAAGGLTMRVDGVNRERRADELILYQPGYDLTTRTNPFGAEAVIAGGLVTSVVDLRGNSPIPRDGFVLSGHGRARQWLLQALQPGSAVSLTLTVLPASADPRWSQVVNMIGGGPRLLTAGQFAGGEGFARAFSERRHPRSAIGVLPDGRIVLAVVDGRQPYHSVGMTLLEFAMELRRMGAVDAMNLDGGGSTTLVVAGRVVNLPADETGERPVSDALLVVPISPSP